MRTRPSASSVAVWPMRPAINEPVGLNLPVVGSYSSAEAKVVVLLLPPTKRTRPSASRVAVPKLPSMVASPVLLNLPVAGSYSSGEVAPFPTIRTRPSVSRVAVPLSEVAIEPVGVKLPGLGGGDRDGVRAGVSVGVGVGLVIATASPLVAAPLAPGAPAGDPPVVVPLMARDATIAIPASAPRPVRGLAPRLRCVSGPFDRWAASDRAASSSVSTRLRNFASSLGSAGHSFISEFLSQAGKTRLQLRLDRVLAHAQGRCRLAHRVALQVVGSDGGGNPTRRSRQAVAQC